MTEVALQVTQTRAEGLIGASDAGAILGLDKHRSPMAVWRELRGEPREEKPAFVQEAARWGQVLEPVVRGHYAISTHSTVWVPNRSLVMDGWLRSTPDGFAAKAEHKHMVGTRDLGPEMSLLTKYRDENTLGLLQVKTCSAYKRDEWADGAVPPAHEVQCRVEQAVTGLPWTDIVCLVGGQQLVGPIRIHRDEKLEHNILRDLFAFWELVQKGIEPAIDGSDAWRSYASSGMRPTKVDLAADDDTRAQIMEWRLARRQISELEQREEAIKTSLLLKLSTAGAQRITSNIGNVTTYAKRNSVSWKDYAISLGGDKEPPEQFRKPGVTWVVKAPSEWSGGDDE